MISLLISFFNIFELNCFMFFKYKNTSINPLNGQLYSAYLSIFLSSFKKLKIFNLESICLGKIFFYQKTYKKNPIQLYVV